MEIIDKAKEKIKNEISEIEKRTDLTKEEKVEQICKVFGTFCGAIAVQPIPFADFFVLTPIQAYMGKKIADIQGYDISEQGATHIFKEIAGLVGMGLLSQQLIISLYKTFIPFLGAITTIPLVFGMTYAMGKVMNAYFKAKIKGEKISKENIQSIFRDAKKQGEILGKQKETEIRSKAKNLDESREQAELTEALEKKTYTIQASSKKRLEESKAKFMSKFEEAKARNASK